MSPGMAKAEVINTLGNPDGFKKVGDYEVFTYTHRLVTGWAWDRADYHIILKDGKVTEYGAGEVRVKDMNTILLVPLRLPRH
ncbi:MAG: hypothetical protein AB1401_04930 [Thermodesulfobacteriota bacterium]